MMMVKRQQLTISTGLRFVLCTPAEYHHLLVAPSAAHPVKHQETDEKHGKEWTQNAQNMIDRHVSFVLSLCIRTQVVAAQPNLRSSLKIPKIYLPSPFTTNYTLSRHWACVYTKLYKKKFRKTKTKTKNEKKKKDVAQLNLYSLIISASSFFLPLCLANFGCSHYSIPLSRT